MWGRGGSGAQRHLGTPFFSNQKNVFGHSSSFIGSWSKTMRANPRMGEARVVFDLIVWIWVWSFSRKGPILQYHDWVDQARSWVKYHDRVDQARSWVNRKSKTYIAVPAEILGIILPLLLGVAFLVLAERKVMAFVQRRKGPDVVGSFGLLQPLADGSKLILKEPISPSSANFSLFRMAPVVTFMLSLVARAVVPFDYGMVLSDLNIGLLYLFAISSLGVYGIIIAGRSSN